jgi:hypothetical protein
VGQLCKHVYGCRVVGAAGTDEKVSPCKHMQVAPLMHHAYHVQVPSSAPEVDSLQRRFWRRNTDLKTPELAAHASVVVKGASHSMDHSFSL